MAELPNQNGEPSEILDLAAVPRPMQHIVVQVDWFQIAEKFLPRPDEEHDVRDLTVAVMTTEEELQFNIDMIRITSGPSMANTSGKENSVSRWFTPIRQKLLL